MFLIAEKLWNYTRGLNKNKSAINWKVARKLDGNFEWTENYTRKTFKWEQRLEIIQLCSEKPMKKPPKLIPISNGVWKVLKRFYSCSPTQGNKWRCVGNFDTSKDWKINTFFIKIWGFKGKFINFLIFLLKLSFKDDWSDCWIDMKMFDLGAWSSTKGMLLTKRIQSFPEIKS